MADKNLSAKDPAEVQSNMQNKVLEVNLTDNTVSKKEARANR